MLIVQWSLPNTRRRASCLPVASCCVVESEKRLVEEGEKRLVEGTPPLPPHVCFIGWASPAFRSPRSDARCRRLKLRFRVRVRVRVRVSTSFLYNEFAPAWDPPLSGHSDQAPAGSPCSRLFDHPRLIFFYFLKVPPF